MNELINRVKNSINNAEQYSSNLIKPILDLMGASSTKVRHFLNNIITSNSRYLEIGCWKGSTFVSALWENNPEIAFAIDNWSQFVDGYLEHPKKTFYNNLNQFVKSKNIHLIHKNCFEIDLKHYNITNINTYFYDGGHSYEDQYKALTYYYKSLSDCFIYIVDDWNWVETVQDGTKNAIKDLNLNILFEQEMPADFNGDVEKWWNGLYICVLKK